VALIASCCWFSGCTDKAGGQGDTRQPAAESPGQAVKIADQPIHYQIWGQGSPPVIVLTGIGETYQSYQPLILQIAQITTVVAWDRPGYGDSESGPFPRTSAQVADELISLLVHAEVAGPYLLLGHSLGGSQAFLMAADNPNLVAGLVLLDPPPLKFLTGQRFADLRRMATAQTEEWDRNAADQRRSGQEVSATFFATIASEHAALFGVDGRRMQTITDLGDLPLIVVASGQPNPAFGDSAAAFQKFWIASNQDLATLSQQGKSILAQDSSHHLHFDAPEIVLQAVTELVRTCRRE
jgi:pimeloyl-ACP methyl ester carboxylesterase